MESTIIDKREQYSKIINEMITSKEGALLYYFKQFLLTKSVDDYWSQPQAIEYCNKEVVKAGGVGWNTSNGGRKNPDGFAAAFGDPGRTLEKFRQEKYDGCWDNESEKPEGPFRLNIQKYELYTGPTKCHSFGEKIKKAIKKRCGGKCELCGYKGRTEIDHFIPKEKGGSSTMENANALCSRCNDRKCAKQPSDFMIEEFDRLIQYFKDRGMTKELQKYYTDTFCNSIS
jgi:hypothetical protein